MTYYQFDSLVIEGGGVKIAGAYGAIERLYEVGILQHIKSVAGTSAGAIIATLIALKVPINAMKNLLITTDFSTFKDSSFLPFGDIYRLCSSFGWNKGDVFNKWIGDIIEEYTGDRMITLSKLYELNKITLVITGTMVNKSRCVYYNHIDHPNMSVVEAVRISMSIPLFFVPIEKDGNMLVDGGVMNNYPIWIFDKMGNITYDRNKQPHNHVIGIKLMNDDQKTDHRVYHGDLPTDSLTSYMTSIISCMMIQIERAHIREGYWDMTIPVNCGDVCPTNFDISLDDKLKMVESGKNAVDSYLNKWKNKPIQSRRSSI